MQDKQNHKKQKLFHSLVYIYACVIVLYMKTGAVHRHKYKQQNILLVTKPLFLGHLPVIAHLLSFFYPSEHYTD